MKVAIISGGSKGLGAALVSRYHGRGYKVVEFSRSGLSENSVKLDLAQPAAIESVVAPIFSEMAQLPLDEVLFVNNAGLISPIGMVSAKPNAAIMNNANVNFTGAIILMRQFLLAFQGVSCAKTVVNISSGAAERPIYGWSLYCAAKAGIEHFIRTVAAEQEGQVHPITAINVSPGLIDTGMQQAIRDVTKDEFPGVERFVEFKKSGALRSPEKVAQAIENILATDLQSGGRYAVGDYV